MSSTALKKPTGVYILAILFLLAPAGNIFISFAGSGLENWYNPSVLMAFLQTIPALEWIWLGLLFITGILLFRPHKLSWSVAIITLLLILFINAYRLYNVDSNSIDPIFLKVFSLLAIICTLSVLIIAFYFRFPYLDRRADWLSNIRRVDIRTSVVCAGVKAITESLSVSGCKITFDAPVSFKKNEVMRLKFPEISAVEVPGTVVENLETTARFEFNDLNSQFKQDLSRWLKSRGQ